ncbi:MAG: hypothetical protein WA948_11700 [Pontixanthobacter sp.]
MKKFVSLFAVTGFALSLAACDVDQTEEGDMPEVDVEGGNLPEYDVEGPDVDVDTGTTTVEVPTLDVDVDGPDDAEGEPVTDPSE